MANLYADKKWTAFREEVIQLDGGLCVQCGRSRSDGVVLQVHHKTYLQGRKPWEYEPEACETLCKGCHAREHGEIRPDTGWDYVGEDDLGDVLGNCELCDKAIRYVHFIQHEHWEQMGVGTVCCDTMTGTQEAAEARRRLGRLKRFIESKKWEVEGERDARRFQGFNLAVESTPSGYRLVVDGKLGRKSFESTLAAKEFIFEFIDSGEGAEYQERRRLRGKIPERAIFKPV